MEIFTDKEWSKLKKSVLWMFLAIAGADQKIDNNELQALNYIKDSSDKIRSKLLKDLLLSTDYTENDITSLNKVKSKEIKTGLREIAKILDKKLNEQESILFKKSLLALGMYIAYASGDLLSSKMSNVESQTIVELSLFMKVSISKYHEEPTVRTIMQELKN